jgi:hypothetical protein
VFHHTDFVLFAVALPVTAFPVENTVRPVALPTKPAIARPVLNQAAKAHNVLARIEGRKTHTWQLTGSFPARAEHHRTRPHDTPCHLQTQQYLHRVSCHGANRPHTQSCHSTLQRSDLQWLVTKDGLLDSTSTKQDIKMKRKCKHSNINQATPVRSRNKRPLPSYMSSHHSPE